MLETVAQKHLIHRPTDYLMVRHLTFTETGWSLVSQAETPFPLQQDTAKKTENKKKSPSKKQFSSLNEMAPNRAIGTDSSISNSALIQLSK